MFSRKTIHDEYVKVIKEIDGGERREPQHVRPATLGGKYGADRGDPVGNAAFDDLDLFGATLDWSTSDAWCIEETSDTMLRAWYLDSPDYGRRFLIYYNSLKLGWIEVSANPEKLFGTVDEFRSDPRARLDMEISMMRFVPQEDAFGLLYQASLLMQGVAGNYDEARERARTLAESAMTGYMWEVMRAGDQYVPDLQFSVDGPYSVFRGTVAHWKETGFDPFLRKRRQE
jgi:hypothetical protein